MTTTPKIPASKRGPLAPVDAELLAKDADPGGIGLDLTEVPADLTGVGVRTWEHLAATFADQPTRFREADRRAVVAYCCAVEMSDEAAKALREHGVLVEGRSEAEKGRPVRSPAWAMWRDASVQVRQWSAELGLSPSSRARMRLPDDLHNPNADNPFSPERLLS
jgi:P27 family predicted phage terminase small subunit